MTSYLQTFSNHNKTPPAHGWAENSDSLLLNKNLAPNLELKEHEGYLVSKFNDSFRSTWVGEEVEVIFDDFPKTPKKD